MTHAAGGRNVHVEKAVERTLQRIDAYIGGEKLAALPPSAGRAAADAQLSHGSNSVRIASLFLVFYSIVDTSWDVNGIPNGIRGRFGDKRLAAELGLRDIKLHNAITAFGENLGWKGNVARAHLRGDPRFDQFAMRISEMTLQQRRLTADYMASRFAESRQLVAPLPPVGEGVLTYARARILLYSLLDIPSEGNIQQFLVAGLLHTHRARYGHEIKTHHVHASDRFDTTAGDIEEFRNGELLRAYEVTVRSDWKNRLGDFRAKMDAANLSKYTILASNVDDDEELAEPADLMRFLEPYGRDFAVVDIRGFVDVFSMELTAEELRRSVNETDRLLRAPNLCGRADIINRFSRGVAGWLDEAS